MPIHLQDTQKVAIPPVDLAYAESRVDTTLKYTLQLLFEANTTQIHLLLEANTESKICDLEQP